jgi:protein-disulfide isomerase
MKKILTTVLCASALTLVGCSTQQNSSTPIDTTSKQQMSNDYAKAIATPNAIKALIDDKSTPSIGPDNAKKAVVIFFDFGCGKCAEISKQISKLIDRNPHVKFIFKAYPSPKRDTKVSNYASLVANEAYLQGGSELFEEYDTAIFGQRLTNGELTSEDVDIVIKNLGIKANTTKLKDQASKEELETKILGESIGFQGPHSIIILPTNLVDMNAKDLVDNVDKIQVIADSPENAVQMDNKYAAKLLAEQIQAKLNKGSRLNFNSI